MKKIEESKNDAGKSNGNEASAGKRIPIIDTLKPKKRLTKQDKEMIKAFEAVMDAIIRQQDAKV
ncbi:MAG: hypothetical protein LH472_07685 [Pyrinomonadaceae bacterium]|nr:hypothetical protein [Pyrinomonadaceae bacterium]